MNRQIKLNREIEKDNEHCPQKVHRGRQQLIELTIGKSRGERRVIFSSSGAIPTTTDLRPPRDNPGELVLRKPVKTGNREEDVVAVAAVDEVEGVEGQKTDGVVGVLVDKRRETDRNAIWGGWCRRVV